MSKENRVIWDALKETNPNITKSVNKGWGNLTSIDPHWQIMMMTEQFGPVGKGWSYSVDYTYTDNYVFAEVTIKWSENYETNSMQQVWHEFGPISSGLPLQKTNGKFDDEATKKCMTDALTKGFSHLGLCSDVFMGKFDDSKYVDGLRKKYNEMETIIKHGKSK